MARQTHSEAWWAKAPPHVLRCTANYVSTGTRCRTEAHPGATVCFKHGARIPSVRQAAATRIQMSVEEAADRLVEWLNDPQVEMRERVKIAHDLLDRGGLGATSKVLVGVVSDDPVETLFRDLLTTPGVLAAPAAEPEPWVLELNRAAAEPDVIEGEVIAETTERAARMPAPPPEDRNPAEPPAHIRHALEQLI